MHPRTRKLLLALAALAAVWAISIVLLLVQLSAPQPAVLVAFAVTALAVPALAGVLVAGVALGMRRRGRASATRIANLERRVEEQRSGVEALPGLVASVERVAAAVEEERARGAERADTIERLEAALERDQERAAAYLRMEVRSREIEQRLRDVDLLAGRVRVLERPTPESPALKELVRKTAELDRELRKLESTTHDVRALRQRVVRDITDSILRLADRQGLAVGDVLTPEQASEHVRALIAEHRYLETLPCLTAFPEVRRALPLSEARALFKHLRRVGYLRASVELIQEIAERFGKSDDARAAALLGSELALYRGDVEDAAPLPAMEGELRPDVALHVVGKALPETQSGYTLRTQYTVEAQSRAGITPVVVAQSGASERPHDATEVYTHGGIRYYLLGGPQRGAVAWDAWLRANIEALADVVRTVRPAVIHVHSDFVNSMIALPVARAYGIPVVNETRGFWEESWLSRVATAHGWTAEDRIAERFGQPDLYSMRVEREAVARSRADAVITLANVMREHIEAVGERLGLDVPETTVVPNAVEARDFPVSSPSTALRAELGIDAGTLVVGYISSIVEYEGIDTLVRAMFSLEAAQEAARATRGSEGPDGVETALAALVDRLRAVDGEGDEEGLRDRAAALLSAVEAVGQQPVRLVVVGDGAELQNLRGLARALGFQSVIFTGRVPHERVQDFYGLMDVFVVPRRRAAVTELVTPLKPFEALSSGRPCVFSDVRALAEIANESGCVALFRADDHHDLARTLADLIADPDRRARMSREGADWVRRARTWDRNAQSYLEVYRSLGLETRSDGNRSQWVDGPAFVAV